MADKFKSQTVLLESPYTRMELAVPHDTNPLAFVSRGIHTAAGGAVKLVMAAEANRAAAVPEAPTPVTITLAAGWHPLRVHQVFATVPVPPVDLLIAD